MRRRFGLLLLSLGCVLGSGCGRRPLTPAGLERNRLFAEILKRSDCRFLGEDGFFPGLLQDAAQPQVQVWSAVALGRIGDPRALPWLSEAMKSPWAAVRSAAAFAAGEIEDRDLLRSEGRSADPRAAAGLRALLDDTSLTVRARATEALGKTGKEEDALEIVRRLEPVDYSGSPERREWVCLAITALMRLRNPAARPLLEKWAAGGDPGVQWRVANAFYRMRDPAVRAALLRLLQSPDTDTRAHAARALGTCGDGAAAAMLQGLLPPLNRTTGAVNPLPVRVSALQALVNLKVADSVPAIANAVLAAPLGRDNPDQVNFAVQAASALGTLAQAPGYVARAIALLEKQVRVPGPVADSSIVALARLLRGNPIGFHMAAWYYRHVTPPAMRAWAAALGEVADDVARFELKRMLARGAAPNAERAELLAVPAVLRALARAKDPALQDLARPWFASKDGVVLRALADIYAPQAGTPAPWRPIIQAYSGIASEQDPETKIALLNRLEGWLDAGEVKSFLRQALQDRVRQARARAALLLMRAGEPGVPVDPGPSAPSMTDLTYMLVASARQDRTIAILETDRGRIEIELFREDAPLTVENFVNLARSGYFNGRSFMRVVPYFVVQGGDPRDDQEGGPGYAIRCEINMRPFERGSVGMALAGKDTGGSQFFITLSPQPHLDGGYTCFGRVISGMEAADRMTPGDRILRVTIEDEITWLDYRRY